MGCGRRSLPTIKCCARRSKTTVFPVQPHGDGVVATFASTRVETLVSRLPSQ